MRCGKMSSLELAHCPSLTWIGPHDSRVEARRANQRSRWRSLRYANGDSASSGVHTSTSCRARASVNRCDACRTLPSLSIFNPLCPTYSENRYTWRADAPSPDNAFLPESKPTGLVEAMCVCLSVCLCHFATRGGMHGIPDQMRLI